jgi:hypothetical protein
LDVRTYLYLAAQAADPRRLNRNTQNWPLIGAATLIPEKPELSKTESPNQNEQAIAA